MRNWRWIVVALVLVGAALVGLVLFLHRPLAVAVATAHRGPLEVAWSADADCSGTVVQVACERSGRVEQLLVREGDRVRRGQLLAEVEASEARQAVRRAQAELDLQRGQVAAEIDGAAAQVRAARAKLQRLKTGYRSEEIAAARARYLAAQSQVEAAQARVEELRDLLSRERPAAQAEVKAAEAALAAAQARLEEARAGPRAEDIAAARAAVEGAEAAVERARKDFDRLKRLYEQQATAASTVDAAREAYLRAKSRAEVARQHLVELEAGTRPEQLRAAQADRDAAEAQLVRAKAQAQRVAGLEKSLAAAKAQLRQAEAARAEAQANLELLRHGYRTEDLAAARAALQQAEAQQAAAQAGAAGVRAAEATLAEARALLDKSRVRAPADGEIVRKLVEVGDVVTPGQPLYEMVAPTRVWVTALVDDQDISKVRQGQKVQVFSEAYPGLPFEGTVSVIGGAAHPKGVGRVRAKVVPVRIEVQGAAGKLKPGMELDVEGKTLVSASALLVPTDALVHEGGRWYVWVVRAGRAQKRLVEVGETTVEETEIRQGLREGDPVVVGDKSKLKPGMRVRPEERLTAPAQ